MHLDQPTGDGSVMTYDALKLGDREILETLSVARREGAMVMLHAENSDCIGWLTERLLAAGLTAPRYHAASRPMLVEREATHRAIALAELVDVPILIVHMSDHAPFRFDGPDGKKAHGDEVSFDQIANGIPGVETRMALLWSEGVRSGRITAQSFVALTSTNAAKLHHSYHPIMTTGADGSSRLPRVAAGVPRLKA